MYHVVESPFNTYVWTVTNFFRHRRTSCKAVYENLFGYVSFESTSRTPSSGMSSKILDHKVCMRTDMEYNPSFSIIMVL